MSIREWIRPFLLGGVDGIVTSFAIVAGVAAGNLSTSTVFIVGISSLVADGMSMGISEFLSVRSQSSNVSNIQQQIQKNISGTRRRELVQSLAKKLSDEYEIPSMQASAMASNMANYPRLFSYVLKDCGGDETTFTTAFWGGLICAISFILCGSIPLLFYALFESIVASIISSLLALIVLGLFRDSENKLRPVVETLGLGLVAGGVAYGLATIVDEYSGSH